MKDVCYFDDCMAWFVVEQEPNAATCERIAGPFASEAEARQAMERAPAGNAA